MNEIATTRTPEVVAAEIRALTGSMLNTVLEIGRRFAEAKDMMPHGEFGKWVEARTDYSVSSANNYMRLYQEYGADQGTLDGATVKSQAFGNLTYSKALALLAVPSEEREEFVETHDVDAMSTRELQQAIRERDEAKAALEKAESELEEARETIEVLDKAADEAEDKLAARAGAIIELQAQVKELENRPVEVAVQEPDPEEIEARVNAALDQYAEKHKAELEKLQKKLDAAEKAKAKADAAAKTAEEAKTAAEKDAAEKIKAAQSGAAGEVKTLQAELAETKRKLAMSSEAVTTFKLHFAAWQRSYSGMMAALSNADAETAGKLKAAVAAQMEGWGVDADH